MYVEHTVYVDIHINSKQHIRRHAYIYSGRNCKASNRTQRSCTDIFSTANSVYEDILSEMLVLLQVLILSRKLYRKLDIALVIYRVAQKNVYTLYSLISLE
jgi:hypothetical protein